MYICICVCICKKCWQNRNSEFARFQKDWDHFDICSRTVKQKKNKTKKKKEKKIIQNKKKKQSRRKRDMIIYIKPRNKN